MRRNQSCLPSAGSRVRPFRFRAVHRMYVTSLVSLITSRAAHRAGRASVRSTKRSGQVPLTIRTMARGAEPRQLNLLYYESLRRNYTVARKRRTEIGLADKSAEEVLMPVKSSSARRIGSRFHVGILLRAQTSGPPSTHARFGLLRRLDWMRLEHGSFLASNSLRKGDFRRRQLALSPHRKG